jgi:hypothetical protein
MNKFFYEPGFRICIRLPLRRTLPLEVILFISAKQMPHSSVSIFGINYDKLKFIVLQKFYSSVLKFFHQLVIPTLGGIYITNFKNEAM